MQRDLDVALSPQAAEVLWDRTRGLARARGIDYFDGRVTSFLLKADGGSALGTITVAWSTPTPQQATIKRIVWDPASGATEEKVWRGIERLVGERIALPRSPPPD